MTGPLVTGPAVILSGRWLAVARQAVFGAEVARHRNGLPPSPENVALLEALTCAVSQPGHDNTPDLPPSEPMTAEEAAKVLGMSKRQVQRIAPQLGGRLIGGRWILDRQAVLEHREGSDRG